MQATDLQQEVKVLTLRVWEMEKRMRRIEEENREIRDTASLIESYFEPEKFETE